MDPAGVAPASLGTNTNMLLHTTRARVHEIIIPQKKLLSQGALSVVPNFWSVMYELIGTISIPNTHLMSIVACG